MNIVGTLKNARRVAVGEDPRAPCLRGQVYGDVKGRFPDGTVITTSTIMEEQGALFRTRFSAYRVESWAGEAANENVPRARFDALNPEQEALAIDISIQIANGARPDAIQILEWAEALYVAEVGKAA